jgi:hypothetical protein
MRFLVLTFIFLFSLFSFSFAKWEQIGLKGTEVTALASGKFFIDTLLIAGTKSSGVFYRMGASAPFSLLTGMGPDSLGPALKAVHCLYMPGVTGIPFLFAGTDSGLFRYIFTSGLPPQWTRMTGVPAEPVFAVTAQGDTCYCATRSEVYRSFNMGNAWAACSTRQFLLPMQRLTTYTSLAVFMGINAGSQMTGSLMAWDGVLHSFDQGAAWKDVSYLPGQSTPRIADVFSLAAYAPVWNRPVRLAAGTQTGIFWAEDFDTGSWHEMEQQNKIAPAKHLYVSYHSKSTIADIFASTDSGVCILSALVKDGEWVLSLKGKANGVASLFSMDPKEWFAAMGDGVYRFTLEEVKTAPAASHSIHTSNMTQAGAVYSLDGRAVTGKCRTGIFIYKDEQSRLKKTFLFPAVK